MSQSLFKTFSSSCVVLFASLFPFRFYANESMFGEPFDTKAQLSFHEHWFDFLLGNRTFLDAGFFYPYQTSFALSDLFLISGPIHAFFRQLGFDILDSLKLATLIVIILGNTGWMILANKILKNQFLQYLLVLTIGTSYTFVGHIYLKPNMAAYGLISWFILNIVYLSQFRTRSVIKNTNSVGAIFLIPILLALNVWYVAYFILLISFIVIVLFIIFVTLGKSTWTFKKLYRDFLSKIHTRILFIWISVSTILGTLFLIVYLPELENEYSNANENFFLNYSPQGSEYFDSTGAGGGITSELLSPFIETSLTSAEMNLGQNLLIFIPFCIILIAQLFNLLKNRILLNFFNLSVIVTVIIFSISTLKNSNEMSLFFMLWDQFSPLRTMRIPIRFNIVFNFIALLYIFYFIERYLFSKKNRSKFSASIFTLLLFFDMQRFPIIYWEKSDLIDQNLLEYSAQLSECKSFVLRRESVGWWKDSIDGMTLAALIKIPTVNGFSSVYPKDYPSFGWTESARLKPIFDWLVENDSLTGSCLISHGSEIIKLDQNSISWTPQQGFTAKEFNQKFEWSWMVFPEGKIIILNSTDSPRNLDIKFKVKSAPCNTGKLLTLKSNRGKILKQTILSNNPISINLKTNITQFDLVELEFITNGIPCKVGSDPRNLYISVNDFQLN
jgi:hypothetical protein